MKASRRIALIAALAAVALTIFVAESQIPPVVPMPGVKLGLANIVTLVAMVLLNRRDALFVLAVLSQTPQRGALSGTLLLAEDELTDYDGAQRGILQIWSVVRSFVVVAVVTYIVFPSDLIGAFGESAAIAWSGQAVNFIVFWLSVAAARIAVVPLCRSAMALVERPLPVDARGGAVYLLTVAAVLLLWYEGIVLSMEAAAF